MAQRNWRQRTVRLFCGAALVWLLVVFGEQVAWACPTCKDSLSNDGNAANLVRGYFWSICFMMSMPFLILGTLCSYFYWEVRKARKAQTAVE